MTKTEILNAWIASKIEKAHEIADIINDNIQAEAEAGEKIDKPPRWTPLDAPWVDECESWEEWLEKNPGTVKPFHYCLTPIQDQTDYIGTLKIIGHDAFTLAMLLSKVNLSTLDENDFYAVEKSTGELIERLGIFRGYVFLDQDLRQRYIEGPGAASAELGQWTLQEARKILEKYGGIAGYKSLARGKKKIARDEIEKKCKLKDSRHVYNIINRLIKIESFRSRIEPVKEV